MKKNKLLICLILVTATAHTQTVAYFEYIHQADSLMAQHQPEQATGYYEKAMAQMGGKILFKHGPRACYAFAGAGKTDEAFQVLNLLASSPLYSNWESLFKTERLASLHQDPRWNLVQTAFQQKDSSILRSGYNQQRLELEEIVYRSIHSDVEMKTSRNYMVRKSGQTKKE